MPRTSRKVWERELSRVLRDIETISNPNWTLYESLRIPEVSDIDYSGEIPQVVLNDKLIPLALKKPSWNQLREIAHKYFRGSISDAQLKAELVSFYDAQAATDNPDYELAVKRIAHRLDDLAESTGLVYVPVSGIQYVCDEGLPLAQCELRKGSEDSDLAVLLRTFQERTGRVPETPADVPFLVASVQGDSGVYRTKGLRLAEDALAVLQLMVFSRVIGPSAPRTMKVPTFATDLVIWQKGEEQFGTDSMVAGSLGRAPIEAQARALLFEHSLEAYNRVFQTDEPGLSRRKANAIRSFSLGILAGRDRDAFINYVIAIESLLSSGRQSRETLGKRVAALIVRTENPLDNPVKTILQRGSKEFGSQLIGKTKRDRQELVMKRFVKLYKMRNDMIHSGHGATWIETDDMLDLESLSRIVIAAVVTGPWEDEKSLREWLKHQVW